MITARDEASPGYANKQTLATGTGQSRPSAVQAGAVGDAPLTGIGVGTGRTRRRPPSPSRCTAEVTANQFDPNLADNTDGNYYPAGLHEADPRR